MSLLTSLLKTEPPERVRSLAELFAIASAMEKEASERYRELAADMRDHGAASTAAVFEHLADEEQRHRDRVGDLSAARSGKRPDLADVRWRVPGIFGDEAGDMAGSRITTPYQALSMAVRNEERTFAFWAYIAAQAPNLEIHQAAEALAREELEHVAMLRRERRRAYHEERRARGPSTGQAASRRRSADEILLEAAGLERHLALGLDRLSQTGESDMRAGLRKWIYEGRQMADETAPAAMTPQPSAADADDLRTILATAELLVEHYLEAADLAQDEPTMTRSQSLAKRAITRLASLQDLAPAIPGR